MNNRKLFFILLLCLVLCFSQLSVSAYAEEENSTAKATNEEDFSAAVPDASEENLTEDFFVDDSVVNEAALASVNSCGEAYWRLSSGTLTIYYSLTDYTAVSTMDDYAPGEAPWYASRASIQKIQVVGVRNIGSYAFYGCAAATSVSIGASVEIIGKGAFSGCSGLTALSLPSSCTTLRAGIIENTAVTELYIPANVAEIDLSLPPSSNTCFKSFAVDENNPDYSARDGILYDYSGTTILCIPAGLQLKGDVNMDQMVNLVDLLMLNRNLSGDAEIRLQLPAADLVEDGTVNLKDLLQLKQNLAENIG